MLNKVKQYLTDPGFLVASIAVGVVTFIFVAPLVAGWIGKMKAK